MVMPTTVISTSQPVNNSVLQGSAAVTLKTDSAKDAASFGKLLTDTLASLGP